MQPSLFSTAKLLTFARPGAPDRGVAGVLALVAGIAAGSLGMAQAAVRAAEPAAAPPTASVQAVAQVATPPAAPTPAAPPAPAGPAWEGRDIDGDGAPDFANPTGEAPRGHDAYGDGCFHASRDGGARSHEGVDYDAQAGQTVVAPISGFVAKIGYAYPGDSRFKYVEIENPALHLQARVFYVDPQVSVGQSVQLGRPIGEAHSLRVRYPGITNHIHLEIAENGRKIDAQTVILARRDTGFAMGMN